MQAFKIGHFRCISRLNQRLEPGLDQRSYPAAQYRLFTEQVRFRLLTETGFDHAGAAAAVGGRVRKRNIPGLAGCILVNGDK